MTLRSVCIHAHFYQPPREDPLTGEIPPEPGAAPFTNWNERIHAECYQPNAQAGNFGRISFNLGPTLCNWLQAYQPETLRRIVAQDQLNRQRFGVGNALAQPYHHTILPLAKRAEKIVQVAWGIADFERHFGRKPQGMWLPETAVDLETLSVLAEQGIEFTILAPWQGQVESQAGRAEINPGEAYRVALPDGKDITVFFYHRDLSAGLSFNPSWSVNADAFVQRELAPRFDADKMQRGEPQLMLIATDGELYGHHQPFRDHFLAHLVNGASAGLGLNCTYPALWLRENPPRRNAEIHEKTSWSCHHGVMRWMGDCECSPGDGVWKAYLRQAFNRLAEALDGLYTASARGLGIDPLELLKGYIGVIQGVLPLADLVAQLAGRRLPSADLERLSLLLQSQWQRQRMFTSCGWFFEDFARLEPRYNVACAAQAVRLAYLATGVNLAAQARRDLKHVVSHQTGLRGDMVFDWQMTRASLPTENA